MFRRRPWLIPLVASLVAVALFVAGVVAWRMTSMKVIGQPCPPNMLCAELPGAYAPHRLHPLRAELLWAASAFFALVAVGTVLRLWRRPSGMQPTAA